MSHKVNPVINVKKFMVIRFIWSHKSFAPAPRKNNTLFSFVQNQITVCEKCMNDVKNVFKVKMKITVSR